MLLILLASFHHIKLDRNSIVSLVRATSSRYPHQSNLAHRKEISNIENFLVNFLNTIFRKVSENLYLKCPFKWFYNKYLVKSFKIPNGLFKLLKSLGWAEKCYRGRKGGNAQDFKIEKVLVVQLLL